MLSQLSQILLAVSSLIQPTPAPSQTTPSHRLIPFPSPQGPYNVGCHTYEATDHSRLDLLAPYPHPRIVVLTTYYPMLPYSYRVPSNTSTTPFVPPATASFLDRSWTPYLPATHSWSQLRTPCSLNSPYLSHPSDPNSQPSSSNPKVPFDPALPTILLSPGGGALRFLYTGLSLALASAGYVVVAMDHMYDAEVVELANETLVHWNPSRAPEVLRLKDVVRVEDVKFVLDWLERVQSIGARSEFSSWEKGGTGAGKKGIVGHSMGGSTVASIMMGMGNETRIKAGVSLDGGLFGPGAPIQNRTELGEVSRPFLLFRSASSVGLPAGIPWDRFWRCLKGWRREMLVKGSTHSSYSDYPVVVELLGMRERLPKKMRKMLGEVGGQRMVEIMGEYVTGFFDFVFKGGNQTMFQKNSTEFPEVEVVR